MLRLCAVVVLVACCLSKEVTISVISGVNAGRKGPPYDTVARVADLTDEAVLIDIMNKAQAEGTFM